MQNQFNKYCENIGLAKDAKILLALSGGLDSMALLYLLHGADYHVEVAHCNFNLRGRESDEDTSFVRDVCNRIGLKLHIKHFDTDAYAKAQAISIQMAARELRYTWFEALRRQRAIDYVATAHHGDDQVETILMNLSRGTGLKGLEGIRAVNDFLIRPLLFTDRAALEHWVDQQNIPYREDSSNASTKYSRNKIRHEVIPALKEINPSLSTTIKQNISRFSGAVANLNFLYEKERSKLMTQRSEQIYIDVLTLKTYPAPIDILYYFLASYGFNDWAAMQKLLYSDSGKTLSSNSHHLLKNREELILIPIEDKDSAVYQIAENQNQINHPINIELSTVSATNFKISKEARIAAVDYDKLTFPLTIRKWQKGDVFYPLGMKGKKKISDFFIDNKMSLFEKDNTWLLCSGNDIVWVIGLRLDDRFKLVENSQKVYLAQLNISDHE